MTEVVLCSFDLICILLSSESHVKFLWDMQASLEPRYEADVIRSLLPVVYSTSQMARHISLLNTLLTGRALDSETVYQTTESKHVLYWIS